MSLTDGICEGAYVKPCIEYADDPPNLRLYQWCPACLAKLSDRFRVEAAAPDLLAALKAMSSQLYGCPWEPEETRRIEAMAQAAIAKAEGRS